MSGRRRGTAISARIIGRTPVALCLSAAVVALVAAAPARAAIGYELNPTTPTLALSGPNAAPHGLAVDQASRRLYVALVSTDGEARLPGAIARFESNGNPAGTFTAGGNAYFAGVGVDPTTQGFYGAEARLELPEGVVGTARMDPFTSGGTMGTPFPLSNLETLPHIAVDSSGAIYYPNDATDTVQVLSSTGTVLEEISCGGCPGGAFGRPVSVALNSNEDLYVVDLKLARVLKFTVSAGSYQFDSQLQSGLGAGAVAVDPSTDDVLVGVLPENKDFHVLAYTSSGVQFDDFGLDLFEDPPAGFDARAAPQMAVDATSHRLYVGNVGEIYLFEKVTISPPTVTTGSAAPVGQLQATLNATVNPKGHTLLDCELEYVDDAEFDADGFADALTAPCPEKPGGTKNVSLKASVSGLSPSTEYHYRTLVSSYAGSTTSGEKTFTTLAKLAPTVITDPATDLANTSATLAGRVNPHGGTVTDCHFDFGTTASYGSTVPCKSSVGPVTTLVTQKVGVQGLAPGTTYHYRLVVTSNAGTTAGGNVTFSTPAPPPPPPPEPELGPELDEPPPPPPLTCKRGFVKRRVGGKAICVRKCRKGFVMKTVRGKVRCVKRPSARRASRRQPAPAGRR